MTPLWVKVVFVVAVSLLVVIAAAQIAVLFV